MLVDVVDDEVVDIDEELVVIEDEVTEDVVLEEDIETDEDELGGALCELVEVLELVLVVVDDTTLRVAR